MKRIKENKRDQGILFSNHYVGDRLSENDEVFLFEKLFNKLDITPITKTYSSEGGSMFSPDDQLAVLLYAYHKGITSSVKMAELLRYNLQFIYLAGGHIIKRRTICDFRLKHIESIKELFTSSTQLALEFGLISAENVFALDGSKIEAHAGYSMTRSKGEWKDRREEILNHVEKYLKECEEQDELEENAEDDGFIVFRKEMKDKMRQELSKEIYAKRSPEVEGVFGQMKYNKGFDKFRLQGLRKVTGEFTLMAISHNLGKIMRNLFQNVQLKDAM